MKTTVGISDRTLGKHSLLNKIVGREVGVMANGRQNYIKEPYTMIDLCAGDGSPSEFSKKSSPQIMQQHHQYLKERKVKSKVVLIEKNKNTFDKLTSHRFDAVHYNRDALQIRLSCIPEKSAMFIHADPNKIEDWPISSGLLDMSPKYTTMLITLGCNVGGLKRLPLSSRKVWFERMDNILEWMPERHDALLVSLCGDAAQWAYLVIGPKVWHDNEKYLKDASDAFKYWDKGIETYRYKPNPSDFYKERNRLFLTAKETENA